MKYTPKIALLSLLAATLLVGTATAAYMRLNTTNPSKADGIPFSIEQRSEVLAENDFRSLLPENLTIQEVLRVSDSIHIVIAYTPLSDDGNYHTTFSLWRVDKDKNIAENIHEFRSDVPDGLTTTIERSFSRNEYILTIDEAWEGIRIVERITLDKEGNIVTIISQSSDMEFTVKSKNHSYTVKPQGETCHGSKSQALTTQSVITKLLVNDEVITLNKPYTVNCSLSEMYGEQWGILFTDIHVSSLDYYKERYIYIPLYKSDQTLSFVLKQDGSMVIHK